MSAVVSKKLETYFENLHEMIVDTDDFDATSAEIEAVYVLVKTDEGTIAIYGEVDEDELLDTDGPDDIKFERCRELVVDKLFQTHEVVVRQELGV